MSAAGQAGQVSMALIKPNGDSTILKLHSQQPGYVYEAEILGGIMSEELANLQKMVDAYRFDAKMLANYYRNSMAACLLAETRLRHAEMIERRMEHQNPAAEIT